MPTNKYSPKTEKTKAIIDEILNDPKNSDIKEDVTKLVNHIFDKHREIIENIGYDFEKCTRKLFKNGGIIYKDESGRNIVKFAPIKCEEEENSLTLKLNYDIMGKRGD